ncbi:NADPH-dependent FMN reductase [Cunninghamella echinulata]|nr:NADPH-dependent FMN reductase [Cunninghamella echinulata]
MNSAKNSWKPFRLLSQQALNDCWVNKLDLPKHESIKILVLYGSLRQKSYSRLLAYEFGRLLEKMGADVRIYNPQGLPLKDDISDKHPKVLELRELSQWSEGQVWVSPEQHGNITGVFKTQIDWIPLSLDLKGRTLAIAQVNGGSQSFNAVNTLRILGRWMRMVTIPNQSSIPKAWTEFDDEDRLKPSSYRDRVVDVAEELYKFTLLLRPHTDYLVDRYSERKEKETNGRLLSQAEKETLKKAEKEAENDD